MYECVLCRRWLPRRTRLKIFSLKTKEVQYSSYFSCLSIFLKYLSLAFNKFITNYGFQVSVVMTLFAYLSYGLSELML